MTIPLYEQSDDDDDDDDDDKSDFNESSIGAGTFIHALYNIAIL